MKNFLDANIMVSYLSNQPQFKNLKKSYCYQKFISILNPKFKQAIAFVYIRKKKLFIALSHPGFKMELNYNKDMFKSLFRILAKNDIKCKDFDIEEVIIFNSNRVSIIKEDNKIESSVPYYKERSSGEFNIMALNSDILDRFKSIQKRIKCHLLK